MENADTPKEIVSRSIIARKTILFWDKFLSWLFSLNARSYLKGKRLYKIDDPFPEYALFLKKYSRFGTERGIICTTTDFEEDIELLRKMLNQINAHYTSSDLKEIICADLWGKGVSYRNMKKGQSLPFFSIYQKTPIIFTLDTSFELWNDIRAFGFISHQKEALLLFRGTDISLLSSSGRASMLSDIDPEGPGLTLFHSSKKAIKDWLQAQRNIGRETRVIGHSMGGSLACYALIEYPELFSKSRTSYATNYPGVNESLFHKWANIESKPSFFGIVTEGDAVSKCGYLLGKTNLFVPEKELPPLQSHEFLFGAEPTFSIYEINIDDENNTKSRKLISKFHKGASTILYQMGLKHILPSKNEEA